MELGNWWMINFSLSQLKRKFKRKSDVAKDTEWTISSWIITRIVPHDVLKNQYLWTFAYNEKLEFTCLEGWFEIKTFTYAINNLMPLILYESKRERERE